MYIVLQKKPVQYTISYKVIGTHCVGEEKQILICFLPKLTFLNLISVR